MTAAETETAAKADGAPAAPADPPAPPAEQPKPPNNRQYGVFTEEVIDLAEDPAAVIEKLKEIVGKDAKGEQIPKVTVLVRVGRAVESDPKRALNAVGSARDLNGAYEVIADSSRSKYDKVTSKIERTIQIG